MMTLPVRDGITLESVHIALDVVGKPYGLEYAVFQMEVGGETGYKHVQGALFFARPVTMATVKHILGSEEVHLEAIRKPKDAVAYCKKEDTREPGTNFVEVGTAPVDGQGHRSDIDVLVTDVLSGMPMYELVQAHPKSMLLHAGRVERLRSLLADGKPAMAPRGDLPPFVCYVHGITGTGKTRFVLDFAKNNGLRVWRYRGRNRFDGYTSQEIALFDDYRWCEPLDTLTPSLLLQATDRYSVDLPARFQDVKWAPHYIFFTSNDPIPQPASSPDWTWATRAAFLRRLSAYRLMLPMTSTGELQWEEGPLVLPLPTTFRVRVGFPTSESQSAELENVSSEAPPVFLPP